MFSFSKVSRIALVLLAVVFMSIGVAQSAYAAGPAQAAPPTDLFNFLLMTLGTFITLLTNGGIAFAVSYVLNWLWPTGDPNIKNSIALVVTGALVGAVVVASTLIDPAYLGMPILQLLIIAANAVFAWLAAIVAKKNALTAVVAFKSVNDAIVKMREDKAARMPV